MKCQTKDLIFLMDVLPDVHICSLRNQECTSSSCGDSKLFKSGSIANSQRILTEINKSGAITNIKVRVESDSVKH